MIDFCGLIIETLPISSSFSQKFFTLDPLVKKNTKFEEAINAVSNTYFHLSDIFHCNSFLSIIKQSKNLNIPLYGIFRMNIHFLVTEEIFHNEAHNWFLTKKKKKRKSFNILIQLMQRGVDRIYYNIIVEFSLNRHFESVRNELILPFLLCHCRKEKSNIFFYYNYNR